MTNIDWDSISIRSLIFILFTKDGIRSWVNSEKLVLEQIAQQHSFEVIHGDGGRPHMSLPEYKEAASKQPLPSAQAAPRHAEEHPHGPETQHTS